jgi:hypothetical protein
MTDYYLKQLPTGPNRNRQQQQSERNSPITTSSFLQGKSTKKIPGHR